MPQKFEALHKYGTLLGLKLEQMMGQDSKYLEQVKVLGREVGVTDMADCGEKIEYEFPATSKCSEIFVLSSDKDSSHLEEKELEKDLGEELEEEPSAIYAGEEVIELSDDEE
jgi:hypothetical protein